ncbi:MULTISPECIES: hypothetical protein [unclassified Tardiphaga]|jgi:hypothetical protein|uniref:hypothetical protein n=1 Tax=unclassified Tardiphaga TaxID=2631404 RepID=UPI000E71F679
MAFSPTTGLPIQFAWSALVMPACEACNDQYSALESTVKPIILDLLQRLPITSSQAFTLLDWLDKVRIGLWLHQLILQNAIGTIDPHLYVNNRIGAKDRLLYLYTLDGRGKGLNAFGIESLIFQHQPSCFALKINDVVLFNASTDYAFSKRCGFWHPERMENLVDGENAGKVQFVGYAMHRKTSHPIVKFPLIKAALRIVQPIAQRRDDGSFFGPLGQNESFHLTHISDVEKGAGVVFQQLDDGVSPIFQFNYPLPFENVDADTNGALKDIIAQVYRFQNYLAEQGGKFVGSPKAVEYARDMAKLFAINNEMRAVMSETGTPSKDGRDPVTLAFRDAMNASRLGGS